MSPLTAEEPAPTAHGRASHRNGSDRRPGPSSAPRRSRHRLTIALTASGLTTALLFGTLTLQASSEPAVIPLAFEGLTVTPEGRIGTVPLGERPDYLPGSRLLAAAPGQTSTVGLALARSLDWLEDGALPGGERFEDLSRAALLDIRTLTLDGRAPVAAWHPSWRFVWPRDAAFVATALGTTGRHDDAEEILGFLQSVQSPDGSFQARYRPDGSGPPDDRGVQTDGTGWALWAIARHLEALPPAERDAAAERLALMIRRSTTHLLALTAHQDRLPPPSSDYWERRESRLTLGTAALVLTGLESAARIEELTGRAPSGQPAGTVTRRALEVREAVVAAFGPGGYPRYAGRTERDTAVAFLLPPFQPTPLPGAEEAWRQAVVDLATPAGGLAPGADWAKDDASWTPTTTVFALTAAHLGETGLAEEWMGWIDAHRTLAGAIPEKVDVDGSPATVAPLLWSSAATLLTLDRLDRDR